MSNNSIVYDNGNSIIKQYPSLIAKDLESHFLSIAKGTGLVPDVISETKNSISMTLLKGESLLSLLESVWRGECPLSDGKKWLSLLLTWFEKMMMLFQSKTGKIPVLEDSHLKNFILNTKTNTITGIDFEHWHWGTKAEGLGIFMAYFESYKESDNAIALKLTTWLFNEIDTMFQPSMEEVNVYMEKQKELLRRRRKTTVFRNNTTAAILVGGKSTRMGEAKEMLLSNEYTFFETILYQLQSFDHIVTSVSKGRGDMQGNIPVIEDIYPDHGPLGALHAVMMNVQTDWIFLFACDMPSIQENGLYHLFSELSEEVDCLIPVYGGYHHPLAGIYHKRVLPTVERLLLEGKYSMQGLLDSVNTHYFNVSKEVGRQLYNINTPREYEIWKRKEDTEDERGKH